MNMQAKENLSEEENVDLPEDDEIEIEIVDDIPDDEKPRRAEGEAADIPDEPSEEEMANYSDSVQKRIKKLTFEAREAERQRQAQARQLQEAVEYAKRVQEENQRLLRSREEDQGSIVQSRKQAATHALTKAQADYRAAYEAGDSEALIKAQSEMNTAQIQLSQIESYEQQQKRRRDQGEVESRLRQQYESQKPQQPQSQQQAPQLTPNQRNWMEKNDWFGKDQIMTATALGKHEELVNNGVEPDSEKYYAEVDKEMRKRFPDRFSGENVSPRQKPATVVAPADRSGKTPRNSVRLTQSQVAIAKRLGVTPQQYAAQLIKEMRNDQS